MPYHTTRTIQCHVTAYYSLPYALHHNDVIFSTDTCFILFDNIFYLQLYFKIKNKRDAVKCTDRNKSSPIIESLISTDHELTGMKTFTHKHTWLRNCLSIRVDKLINIDINTCTQRLMTGVCINVCSQSLIADFHKR